MTHTPHVILRSIDKRLNCSMCLSLRAPERCVAIYSGKMRLLRFTRNDNLYCWIEFHLLG
jgi:hypothetical protein